MKVDTIASRASLAAQKPRKSNAVAADGAVNETEFAAPKLARAFIVTRIQWSSTDTPKYMSSVGSFPI